MNLYVSICPVMENNCDNPSKIYGAFLWCRLWCLSDRLKIYISTQKTGAQYNGLKWVIFFVCLKVIFIWFLDQKRDKLAL